MKAFLFLALFFLVGCHRSPWQHTSIRSGNDRYDIAKLTYSPSNEINGIELEIVRSGKEVHGYINVHHLQLPKNPNDCQTTTLAINTNSNTKTFAIPLFEGRQRARLTECCLEYLLQCLELNPLVTLSSGHFAETINASKFERHYEIFLRKPNMIQPRSMINLELF